MSSVAFHSPDQETVRVGGAERHWMAAMVRRIFDGVLDVRSYPSMDDSSFKRMMRLLKPADSLHSYQDLHKAAEFLPSAIEHGFDDDRLSWNGNPVNPFSMSLNTALIVGSDPIRLSARIHAQCEIHGWVDGRNRDWMAGIIEEGLSSGVFRDARQTQYGNWPGVIALLRRTAETPVVMSYSVCESFPNPGIAMPEPDKTWKEMSEDEQQAWMDKQDEWREQDAGKQWDQAFAALKESDMGLEIKPDNWKTFHFDPKISAFDILAHDWTERLDRLFQSRDRDGR